MTTQIRLSESKAFKIECELRNAGKTLFCQPHGEITEAADLNPLQAYIEKIGAPLEGLLFDLGTVFRINSYGVRNWLILLRSIPKSIRMDFERVSEALMDQAILLPDFLGRDLTHVKSFFAPYLCQKCNKSSSELISMPEFLKDISTLDRGFQCSVCKSQLEFDGIPDEYNTLRNLKKSGSQP